MIKEVEDNMRQMVNTFKKIIQETSNSKTEFHRDVVESFASELQNNYDMVIESIEKLELPEQS